MGKTQQLQRNTSYLSGIDKSWGSSRFIPLYEVIIQQPISNTREWTVISGWQNGHPGYA